MRTKISSQPNFEDYASGRVIYSTSGATNFPVRLSNKIFELCAAHLQLQGKQGPYSLYDPFCGVAYTLTTLGFIYPKTIRHIFASDADNDILEYARKNLSLLTESGITARISELRNLANKYGKLSHRDALASAHTLKTHITNEHIEIDCFRHNVLLETTFPNNVKAIDIVMVDLPYGKLTQWIGDKGKDSNCQVLLNTLRPLLNAGSIVAITADKNQSLEHEGFKRVKKFNTGKRKTILLQKLI